MAKIKLYHGTSYQFSDIDLRKCKDRKDFGKGFYLAVDLIHAVDLAKKEAQIQGIHKRHTFICIN